VVGVGSHLIFTIFNLRFCLVFWIPVFTGMTLGRRRGGEVGKQKNKTPRQAGGLNIFERVVVK